MIYIEYITRDIVHLLQQRILLSKALPSSAVAAIMNKLLNDARLLEYWLCGGRVPIRLQRLKRLEQRQ